MIWCRPLSVPFYFCHSTQCFQTISVFLYTSGHVSFCYLPCVPLCLLHPFSQWLEPRLSPSCYKKLCCDQHLSICFCMALYTSFSRAASGMELVGHRDYAYRMSLIASRLFSSIAVPLSIPTGVQTGFLPLCTPSLSLVII